jgi:hypothetical protein
MSSQLSSGGAPIGGSRGREDAHKGAVDSARRGRPKGGGAAVDGPPEQGLRRGAAAAGVGSSSRASYGGREGEARAQGGSGAHRGARAVVGDGRGASPAANRTAAGRPCKQ